MFIFMQMHKHLCTIMGLNINHTHVSNMYWTYVLLGQSCGKATTTNLVVLPQQLQPRGANVNYPSVNHYTHVVDIVAHECTYTCKCI